MTTFLLRKFISQKTLLLIIIGFFLASCAEDQDTKDVFSIADGGATMNTTTVNDLKPGQLEWLKFQSRIYPQANYNNNVGFWKYLPAKYTASGTETYPLIIFLHGKGERGSNQNMVLTQGIPKVLKEQTQLQVTNIGLGDVITIAPQHPDMLSATWKWTFIDEVITSVMAKYRVDRRRIYITGYSTGARGSLEYAVRYPTKITAWLAISPKTDVVRSFRGPDGRTGAQILANIPGWFFHGANDRTSDNYTSAYTEMFWQEIKNAKPVGSRVETKFSKPYNVGHVSWNPVYEDRWQRWTFVQKGVDPYQNVYKWLKTKYRY